MSAKGNRSQDESVGSCIQELLVIQGRRFQTPTMNSVTTSTQFAEQLFPRLLIAKSRAGIIVFPYRIFTRTDKTDDLPDLALVETSLL